MSRDIYPPDSLYGGNPCEAEPWEYRCRTTRRPVAECDCEGCARERAAEEEDFMQPTEPIRVVPHVGVFCVPCDMEMSEEESASCECVRFVCPKCNAKTKWEELPQ